MNKSEFINRFIEYKNNEINLRYKLDKKENVRKNNINTDNFLKFINENKNNDFFIDALCDLMNNDNPEIRVSAAIQCIRNDINKKKAIRLLKKESVNKSENARWSSFFASNVLKNI